MKNYLLLGTMAAALLAGCGGGSSVPPPMGTPPTGTPPTGPITPTMATAQGHVVDEAANTPLAGVPIAIASPGSNAFTAEGSSASDGSFSFTASPGTYIIAVGSNSASSAAVATAHDQITLVAGSNAIGEHTAKPVPQVTPTVAQTSGNFRLATLSAAEQDCLAGMNTGRAAHGLSLLVADEETLEVARALVAEEIAQQTDTPTPMFGATNPFLNPTGIRTRQMQRFAGTAQRSVRREILGARKSSRNRRREAGETPIIA